MGQNFLGCDRAQELLLPPSLREWLPEDHAVADRGIVADQLTLGSDNGTAFTSRAFRGRLAELGIVHRRGGYRDPESQAFIE